MHEKRKYDITSDDKKKKRKPERGRGKCNFDQ